MTETKTATRYTPDEVILTPCDVWVPDNERDYNVAYPGYAVELPERSTAIGLLWNDSEMWCWKTPTASAYGRHEIKRFAIAALLGVVQQ